MNNIVLALILCLITFSACQNNSSESSAQTEAEFKPILSEEDFKGMLYQQSNKAKIMKEAKESNPIDCPNLSLSELIELALLNNKHDWIVKKGFTLNKVSGYRKSHLDITPDDVFFYFICEPDRKLKSYPTGIAVEHKIDGSVSYSFPQKSTFDTYKEILDKNGIYIEKRSSPPFNYVYNYKGFRIFIHDRRNIGTGREKCSILIRAFMEHETDSE